MRFVRLNGNSTILISKFQLVSFCFVLILSLLSSIKPLDLLPDMGHYKAYFEDIKYGGEVMVESSFIYISKVVSALYLNFQSVIFIYVVLSLYIKTQVFRCFYNNLYILFLYGCSFLILHEFVQIRVALAISFLMLSFLFFVRKNNYLMIVSWCFAVFFHVSAAIFPVIFLVSVVFARKLYLLKMVFFTFIFLLVATLNGYTVFDNVIAYFPSIFQDKLSIYVEMQSYLNESVNFLSVRLLIVYLVIFLYILKIDKVNAYERVLVVMMLNFLIFGVVFSFLPSISFRVMELSGPFLIILLVGMLRQFHLSTTIFVHTAFVFSSFYYSYSLFL